MSYQWYHYAAAVIVGVVALPALVVGGGFLIPIVVAIVVGIAVIGGPAAWELYNNKRIGEKGNADLRQLLTPDDDGGGASVDTSRTRRGGK